MTQRLPSLAMLGLLALAACLASAGLSTAAAAPRNVLLYVVDDQGSGDAGCYGNTAIKTPGVDAIAAAGMRFDYGFCTTASCSASRSVILSGMHNHANGQYGHQHSFHHFISFDKVQSLPVQLDKAGYRTASAGKYHVAPESVYHFQQYIKGSSPADMADNCASLIKDDGDKPFFLYFCTREPHRPFVRAGFDTFTPDEVIVPGYLPDTAACRKELAQYYGSVARADSGLVRLIEILKETGHWDDTLVIFISDNGIAFPGAKTNLYEAGMRLPCVVRNPYAKQHGGSTDAMVNWADITPTILDYAGAMPKQPMHHGRSFLKVLDGEKATGWDEVYASHTFHEITMYYPMRVARTRRYKLIWNIAHGLDYPFASDLYASLTWQDILKRKQTNYGPRSVEQYIHRPKFELFDLQEDPLEANNLADDPQHAAVLEQLKEKLEAFQKRTGDPWIVKWKYE